MHIISVQLARNSCIVTFSVDVIRGYILTGYYHRVGGSPCSPVHVPPMAMARSAMLPASLFASLMSLVRGRAGVETGVGVGTGIGYVRNIKVLTSQCCPRVFSPP